MNSKVYAYFLTTHRCGPNLKARKVFDNYFTLISLDIGNRMKCIAQGASKTILRHSFIASELFRCWIAHHVLFGVFYRTSHGKQGKYF